MQNEGVRYNNIQFRLLKPLTRTGRVHHNRLSLAHDLAYLSTRFIPQHRGSLPIINSDGFSFV